jgi:hypothetical protein
MWIDGNCRCYDEYTTCFYFFPLKPDNDLRQQAETRVNFRVYSLTGRRVYDDSETRSAGEVSYLWRTIRINCFSSKQGYIGTCVTGNVQILELKPESDIQIGN